MFHNPYYLKFFICPYSATFLSKYIFRGLLNMNVSFMDIYPLCTTKVYNNSKFRGM